MVALCETSKICELKMTMQVHNPSIDENFTANASKPPLSPVPMQCSTEYKHPPNLFRLPASSPYDNFLKAAGC